MVFTAPAKQTHWKNAALCYAKVLWKSPRKELMLLELTEEVSALTKAILKSGVIPQKAVRDAAHIAVATVHEVNYLLTWNCKHIANAHIIKKLEKICALSGFQMPIICTPENLLEDEKC